MVKIITNASGSRNIEITEQHFETIAVRHASGVHMEYIGLTGFYHTFFIELRPKNRGFSFILANL